MRKLGRTGLFVSELALGTMTFGGKGWWEVFGKLGASALEDFLGRSFDAGVNLIDTADVYSNGESERLLGEVLAKLKRPREEMVIGTKVRVRTGPGPNAIGLSASHIHYAIDRSLQRLRLDHVDLYQIHGYDRETPIEETLRALEDVVRAGKARYIGFSNLAAWQAMKALGTSDARGWSRFVSGQVYYSLAGRDIERELVPLAQEENLGLLVWSPLASGALSGKYDADLKGPSGSRRESFQVPPVDAARFKRILPVLQSVASETGHSVAQVAIAWILSKEYITSVVVGASRLEQLDENLKASSVALSSDHVAALDAASEIPNEYPGWMIAFQNRDRVPE